MSEAGATHSYHCRDLDFGRFISRLGRGLTQAELEQLVNSFDPVKNNIDLSGLFAPSSSAPETINDAHASGVTMGATFIDPNQTKGLTAQEQAISKEEELRFALETLESDPENPQALAIIENLLNNGDISSKIQKEDAVCATLSEAELLDRSCDTSNELSATCASAALMQRKINRTSIEDFRFPDDVRKALIKSNRFTEIEQNKLEETVFLGSSSPNSFEAFLQSANQLSWQAILEDTDGFRLVRSLSADLNRNSPRVSKESIRLFRRYYPQLQERLKTSPNKHYLDYLRDAGSSVDTALKQITARMQTIKEELLSSFTNQELPRVFSSSQKNKWNQWLEYLQHSTYKLLLTQPNNQTSIKAELPITAIDVLDNPNIQAGLNSQDPNLQDRTLRYLLLTSSQDTLSSWGTFSADDLNAIQNIQTQIATISDDPSQAKLNKLLDLFPKLFNGSNLNEPRRRELIESLQAKIQSKQDSVKLHGETRVPKDLGNLSEVTSVWLQFLETYYSKTADPDQLREQAIKLLECSTRWLTKKSDNIKSIFLRLQKKESDDIKSIFLRLHKGEEIPFVYDILANDPNQYGVHHINSLRDELEVYNTLQRINEKRHPISDTVTKKATLALLYHKVSQANSQALNSALEVSNEPVQLADAADRAQDQSRRRKIGALSGGVAALLAAAAAWQYSGEAEQANAVAAQAQTQVAAVTEEKDAIQTKAELRKQIENKISEINAYPQTRFYAFDQTGKRIDNPVEKKILGHDLFSYWMGYKLPTIAGNDFPDLGKTNEIANIGDISKPLGSHPPIDPYLLAKGDKVWRPYTELVNNFIRDYRDGKYHMISVPVITEELIKLSARDILGTENFKVFGETATFRIIKGDNGKNAIIVTHDQAKPGPNRLSLHDRFMQGLFLAGNQLSPSLEEIRFAFSKPKPVPVVASTSQEAGPVQPIDTSALQETQPPPEPTPRD